MAEDLKKGEWTESKFLDMLKERNDLIAGLNDKTVEMITEQLYSTDEVKLFAEEISKKKLISSTEFTNIKKSLFAYDLGVTLDDKEIKSYVTLDHDQRGLLSAVDDIESLDYNQDNSIKNTFEKPGIDWLKTVGKGLKNAGKIWMREGWNVDIKDFFSQGIERSLSDFIQLVGNTYNNDSRFRSQYDAVFSKILGGSESAYSSVLDSLINKGFNEVHNYNEENPKKQEKTETKSTTETESQENHEAPTPPTPPEQTTNTANQEAETKSEQVQTETKNKNPQNSWFGESTFNSDTNVLLSIGTQLAEIEYEINDVDKVKKFNVLINFIDFVFNKWKANAMTNEMISKHSMLGRKYSNLLLKFIGEISNALSKSNGEFEDMSIRAYKVYKKIGDNADPDNNNEINSAIAYMLYLIYIAKANFDNNKSSGSNNNDKNTYDNNNLIEHFKNIKLEDGYSFIRLNGSGTEWTIGPITVNNKPDRSVVLNIDDFVKGNKDKIKSDKKLRNFYDVLNENYDSNDSRKTTLIRDAFLELVKYNSADNYAGLTDNIFIKKDISNKEEIK